MKLRTVRGINPRLTLYTIKEVEYYAWTRPPSINSFKDAGNMEYMATADLNTGTLVVPFRVADWAVVITILTHSESFVFLNTFGIKARQALLLSSEAATSVTTS